MGDERKVADVDSHAYGEADEAVKHHIMQIDNIDGHPVSVQWPLDPVREKKLMRKVDWILIPWLFFLFLLAFLDRVNSMSSEISC